MYCRNCGKEINDTASFCPCCGTAASIKRPEVKNETVHRGMNEEELPVYKRKNKAAFLVGFLPLIYAFCKLGIDTFMLVVIQ